MNTKHTSLCISLFWNIIQWIVPNLTSFKQKFSSVHFCLWNYAVSWNKKKQIMQFTVIKINEWPFFAYTYITFIATWICVNEVSWLKQDLNSNLNWYKKWDVYFLSFLVWILQKPTWVKFWLHFFTFRIINWIVKGTVFNFHWIFFYCRGALFIYLYM